MKLYSYVIARDYGFAPNPFFGVCTLATCKPKIRKAAKVGDWILGTGSSAYGLRGTVVFAMKVAEVLTYNQYWADARFISKRPNLTGSFKQAFGDNIYHQHPRTGRWLQVNSHHSFENGKANPANIKNDTQSPNVLIGTDFIYWGASGPKIPSRFRKSRAGDICAHRGHKCNFPDRMINAFIAWLRSRGAAGYAGKPAEFPKI